MTTITTTLTVNVLAITVLFLAAPVFGATVTSDTCSASANGFVSAGNSDACSVPGATANSSASAEIGGFPSQPPFPNGTVVPADSTVYGFVIANAQSFSGSLACETINHPFPCPASASISASETITFQTLGSLRPGIADLYTYGLATDVGDGARASDGAGAVESSSPVELGTTLSVSGFASASTDGVDGEGAQGYENFWYVIYEADGVTPVTVLDVAEAPEPSTWALTLLPLALLSAASILRTRHRRTKNLA